MFLMLCKLHQGMYSGLHGYPVCELELPMPRAHLWKTKKSAVFRESEIMIYCCKSSPKNLAFQNMFLATSQKYWFELFERISVNIQCGEVPYLFQFGEWHCFKCRARSPRDRPQRRSPAYGGAISAPSVSLASSMALWKVRTQKRKMTRRYSFK